MVVGWFLVCLPKGRVAVWLSVVGPFALVRSSPRFIMCFFVGLYVGLFCCLLDWLIELVIVGSLVCSCLCWFV